MSLVPDRPGVLPEWPTRQRQNYATQEVGITGDVDGVNAVVSSDTNLQQHLWAPARRDHDAGDTVDKHDGAGARPPGEPSGLLGDLPGPAQLSRHIIGNQHPINCAHHLGSQQFEQSGDVTPTRRRQKRFDDLEVLV